MKKNTKNKMYKMIITLIILVGGYIGTEYYNSHLSIDTINSIEHIPEYNGNPYIIINNNEPNFSESELTVDPFEKYSELDYLGRCGVAFANVCKETMPTEERGYIGMIKPTGWQIKKYDFIDGKYLYNRCHLIGYQLTGENANEKNLITGTRYMNVEGMLPFENKVADYVEETNNHVLYKVTPIFEGNNLVADGVLMEAMSVEDHGKGLKFNVFIYNVQPNVEIDYLTGTSKLQKKVENKEALAIMLMPFIMQE